MPHDSWSLGLRIIAQLVLASRSDICPVVNCKPCLVDLPVSFSSLHQGQVSFRFNDVIILLFDWSFLVLKNGSRILTWCTRQFPPLVGVVWAWDSTPTSKLTCTCSQSWWCLWRHYCISCAHLHRPSRKQAPPLPHPLCRRLSCSPARLTSSVCVGSILVGVANSLTLLPLRRVCQVSRGPHQLSG